MERILGLGAKGGGHDRAHLAGVFSYLKCQLGWIEAMCRGSEQGEKTQGGIIRYVIICEWILNIWITNYATKT